MPLNIDHNLKAPDEFYEALIDAHKDLSDQESQAFNARLIMLLSNHIGSIDVLREAFRAARLANLAHD